MIAATCVRDTGSARDWTVRRSRTTRKRGANKHERATRTPCRWEALVGSASHPLPRQRRRVAEDGSLLRIVVSIIGKNATVRRRRYLALTHSGMDPGSGSGRSPSAGLPRGETLRLASGPGAGGRVSGERDGDCRPPDQPAPRNLEFGRHDGPGERPGTTFRS